MVRKTDGQEDEGPAARSQRDFAAVAARTRILARARRQRFASEAVSRSSIRPWRTDRGWARAQRSGRSSSRYGARREVRRMVLFGVGQFAQHVLQVVVDHQMMPMRTADDAVHLQTARRSLGMP